MVAILFGGPFDGRVYNISHIDIILEFPLRKSNAQMMKEGESLNVLYSEITYYFAMDWNNETCLYLWN